MALNHLALCPLGTRSTWHSVTLGTRSHLALGHLALGPLGTRSTWHSVILGTRSHLALGHTWHSVHLALGHTWHSVNLALGHTWHSVHLALGHMALGPLGTRSTWHSVHLALGHLALSPNIFYIATSTTIHSQFSPLVTKYFDFIHYKQKYSQFVFPTCSLQLASCILLLAYT